MTDMHVKRLYRPTVRDALTAAREELGPRALVLSTELVPAPGWRGWVGQRVVRLTAAAERPVSDERPDVPGSRQPTMNLDAPRAGVAARLAAAGVDPALAAAVVARMSSADCRGGSDVALRRALAAELAALTGSEVGYERFEVFVGPPGVGKTTTIAKIAAQERALGGRTLSLVAADAFRAGAIEQLRSYAAVLGAPFRIARNAEELEQAIGASRHTSLVDTAGRSPADGHLADLIAVLERTHGVRTHLVMAADTSAATARRIFDRYGPMQPSRVVITKLDESESLAPLLAVVRERALPVSYLGTGQRVPEDLWRATPAGLAAALLREPAMEDVTCH
jgi:flagellar biosynthesis protein FlhF